MKKIRFIPYGYTIREGRTVIAHEEAQIIREIFEEYIKGASLKTIAEELTARKVPYTEKTDLWDKARIARIIDNAKYIGDEEYDPIIDESTYEDAVSMKAARQRNSVQLECEGIALLRDRVKCEACNSPMVRRITAKCRIKESWTCQNPECGKRLRIRDGDLLRKVTITMNRIIENNELLLPRRPTGPIDSPVVAGLQQQVDMELSQPYPSESYIMEKISEIAGQLYKESQAQERIAARIAQKRASMMKPQENFNGDYFSDLIDYITLSNTGRVRLYTKVGTEVAEEGEEGQWL